jgi:hypothetical protein
LFQAGLAHSRKAEETGGKEREGERESERGIKTKNHNICIQEANDEYAFFLKHKSVVATWKL